MNKQISHEFLSMLFANCHMYQDTTYITLSAIHPDHRHSVPSRHIPLNQHEKVQSALQQLYAANELGWGAFFGVATRKRDLGRWRRGGLADLASLPALFVDLDMRPSEAMRRLQGREPPSALVLSGYGLHAYWFLDEPSQNWQDSKLALQSLQKDLAADRSSLAQSMRLPLSRNTKPERKNALCEILHLSEIRYPLEAFIPKSEIRQNDLTLGMKKQKTGQHFPEKRQINPRLTSRISELLQRHYEGYWRTNGWLAARCPCPHEHDLPGAHFSFKADIGLGVCLGKHGKMLLKDLCSLLGLEPATYGGLFI